MKWFVITNRVKSGNKFGNEPEPNVGVRSKMDLSVPSIVTYALAWFGFPVDTAAFGESSRGTKKKPPRRRSKNSRA